MSRCSVCNGTGFEPCPVCHGDKKDPRNRDNPCSYCNGLGFIKCNACKGEGTE